jgi:hypothetical protein
MGAQAARIGEALRKEIEGVCKMLTLEIARELKRATPVDTGHARRNWIPSVGEPNAIEAQDDAAYKAGVAQVVAYTLSQGALWVANVVPYIKYLNYGSSTKAPAGFIEMSIDLALQTVERKYTGKAIDVSAIRANVQSSLGGDAAENLAGAYSPFGDE